MNVMEVAAIILGEAILLLVAVRVLQNEIKHVWTRFEMTDRDIERISQSTTRAHQRLDNHIMKETSNA
jgi:hypothetical protein